MPLATANSNVHFLGSVFHKKRKTHISLMASDSLIASPSNSVLLGARIVLIRLLTVCLLGNDEFNSHFPWDNRYRLCNYTLAQNRKIP